MLLIGKKKIDTRKPGYYLSLTWMHGDADGEEKTSVGPWSKETETLLHNFTDMLDTIAACDDSDDLDMDEMLSSLGETSEEQDFLESLDFEIPRDPITDYDRPSHLVDYCLEFVNAMGDVFEARIE